MLLPDVLSDVCGLRWVKPPSKEKLPYVQPEV